MSAKSVSHNGINNSLNFINCPSLASSGWSANCNIKCSAYGNGKFIVGGAAGGLATSPDGITWTQRFLPIVTTWTKDSVVEAIVWNGSKFVAGGAGGRIATSPDGITWTYQPGLRASGWG